MKWACRMFYPTKYVLSDSYHNMLYRGLFYLTAKKAWMPVGKQPGDRRILTLFLKILQDTYYNFDGVHIPNKDSHVVSIHNLLDFFVSKRNSSNGIAILYIMC